MDKNEKEQIRQKKIKEPINIKEQEVLKKSKKKIESTKQEELNKSKEKNKSKDLKNIKEKEVSKKIKVSKETRNIEKQELKNTMELKKTEEIKEKFKPQKYTIFLALADLCAVIVLFIIYFTSFKNFWIPTAMTTMNHRYLAYTFYNQDTIDKVMSANYVEDVTEKINLDDIIIGNTGEKKSYSSKYEEQIFKRDTDNEVYKIIPIEEPNFKGYLTVIYDPSDVELAVPKKLGKQGASVNTLVKENNALVGINGGGFEDIDGWGNGSTPYGKIIQNGKLIWDHGGATGYLIGFTKDHKMYLTNDNVDVAISNGMKDAVEFGPYLIVNGKAATVHGNGGWGTAPRTVIAQRKDGIVLFLVVDGRSPGYSIGATMNELIEVLLRYKAYNAANLDGGASTTMSVNGKLYNKPYVGSEYGGRTVSNAWIVTNKQNKKCKITAVS